MSTVLAVLQRLVVPAILLAAFIGATVALDRFDNDPIVEPDTTVDIQTADTPVFSARRGPEMLTSQRAADELTAALDGWVATLPPSSCFVVSAGGDRLFSHQPDIPLIPASNMKILTAAAALQGLGRDYTYQTRVAAPALPDANGRLNGNLYVIGGGDPLLMTDVYRDSLPDGTNPIHSSANLLADQTVAANLSDISGAVLVDESRYDEERAPAGIAPGLLDAGRIGSLGAAIIDRGFVGFKEGYATQDVAEGEPPPLPRSTDPAAQFAAVFDDLLEAINVRITTRAAEAAEVPADLVDLVVFDSPPMARIVEQMLTDSDNTTAEMIIKELGFVASDSGTTTSGTLAMSNALRDAGLNDAGLFALDGSGLSTDNTVTCSLLHDALNSAHKDDLRAAMPVAGETGTLADDFVGTSGEGRIRAKTGLLAQAAALSGYFETDPGVELTFSLVINVGEGETITEEQVRGWTLPLPDLLAPYPAGPALADLGPVGVPLEPGG